MPFLVAYEMERDFRPTNYEAINKFGPLRCANPFPFSSLGDVLEQLETLAAIAAPCNGEPL